MANKSKKISELPSLNAASLDTTYVVGISGSTTYKISINNLTSSLDGAFATDLVTSALSSSLNSKLSTSSFNQYTASAINGTISGSSQLTSSFDTRYVISGSVTQTTWDNIVNKPAGIVSQSTDLSSLNTFTASISTASLVTSIDNLNTFTASQSTSSLVNRLNAIESVSGSWITESETGSFLTSLSGAISSSSQLTSSFDARYTLSGSVQPLPLNLLSSSAQITAFGFVSSSSTIDTGSLDLIGFNTSAGISVGVGQLAWNNTDGTLDLGMKGGNVVQQIGQEIFYEVRNETGIQIPNGTAVYANGVTVGSGRITIAPYVADGSIRENRFLGIATENITSGINGFVTHFGYVRGLDTRGTTASSIAVGDETWVVGDILYVHPTVAGKLTKIKPQHEITVAIIINRHQSAGVIFVRPSSAGHLEDIHDISINTGSLSNGQVLSYNSTLGVWENTNTISNSSQLTSSYDGRYVQTGSFNILSSSVDNRLDTLEATIISGSPNYTQVLGNRRTSITTTGVSIISGSITTTGNPVQIMVTGDANPVNVSSWTRLQIYRNETAIGNIVQVENSSNLNVPYCVNVIDTASAGTYTYSMRTVSGISGLFDFGESTGPTLTIVELNTNTNLPSTNNTFTGTNRFNGQVTLGGAGGDEGGELQLATAQTNSTLAAGVVSVDVYRDRLRIFEGGGNSRGVYIDLSKAPAGNAGELMWKASGMVAAGTFVTLDNLKATITTSGSRGLSIGAVSTTFEADLSGWYAASVGSAGGSTNNISYTTTASTSLFNWNFVAHGDTAHYHIRDKTNNRFYRVTMMIGIGYDSNFISIERLF